MNTTTTRHPLVSDYLARLRAAARGLPAAQRRELEADIEAHLVEALGDSPSDAEVLDALDRLGEPEEIVDAGASPRRDERGVHEWAAIFLLLLGGLIVGLGWIAGVILLWSSRLWTTRDKLIGTLVVPGGLATGLVLTTFAVGSAGVCTSVTSNGGASRTSCVGEPGTATTVVWIVVMAIALIGPFATAFYLARRAGRA